MLSVRQPWASAIIWAGKDVKNRTWATAYRGRFYTHARQKLEAAEVLPLAFRSRAASSLAT